jgi:hypothetical protein
VIRAVHTLAVRPEDIEIRVHLISKPERQFDFDSCKSTMRALRANPGAYHFEVDVCFEEVASCAKAILLLGARRGAGPYTVDGEPFCHEAWSAANKRIASITYTQITGQKGVEATFRKNNLIPFNGPIGDREVTDLKHDVSFWYDGWRHIIETICRIITTRAQNQAADGGRVFDGEDGQDPNSVEQPLLHGLLRTGKEENFALDGVGTIIQHDLNQLMDHPQLYEHVNTKALRRAMVERLVITMDNKALHIIMNNYSSSSDRAVALFCSFMLRSFSADVFYQVHKEGMSLFGSERERERD